MSDAKPTQAKAHSTLDQRIADLSEFDIDALLEITSEEMEWRDDKPSSLPEPSQTVPTDLSQKSGPFALSGHAASTVDTSGGEASGSQIDLNHGTFTTWREREPEDTNMTSPVPMLDAEVESSESTEFPDGTYMGSKGPGTGNEEGGSMAHGKRKGRRLRARRLAKAELERCSRSNNDGDVQPGGPFARIRQGEVGIRMEDVPEPKMSKILRQRRARKNKTTLARKGKLMDMQRQLREALGLVNAIQGDLECPECGRTVILQARVEKAGAEREGNGA